MNFWGAREVYLCEFERSTEARETYSSVNQPKKVKTKKKRSSCQKFSQILVVVSKFLAIFHEFFSEDQKKKEKVFVQKVL